GRGSSNDQTRGPERTAKTAETPYRPHLHRRPANRQHPESFAFLAGTPNEWTVKTAETPCRRRVRRLRRDRDRGRRRRVCVDSGDTGDDDSAATAIRCCTPDG